MLRSSLFSFLFLMLTGAAVADEANLKTSPLAVAYGSHPDIQSPRLSPDGSKMAFLQSHPEGYEFLRMLDFDTKKLSGVIAYGKKDEVELKWCRWASAGRFLCGISSIDKVQGRPMFGPQQQQGQGKYYARNQVSGVNIDGSDMQVFAGNPFGMMGSQDFVIDWLPDDKDHVAILESAMDGAGLARLDIYKGGEAKTFVKRKKGARSWITDGHGVARLYMTSSQGGGGAWYGRSGEDGKWEKIHETAPRADDRFQPVGFGANLDELLYTDINNGRSALFAMNLAAGSATRLVFGHPEADVGQPVRMGKYNRIVGVTYNLEREHQEYFDPKVKDVYDRLTLLYPDDRIAIVDEDWNGRYYLVSIETKNDAGSYYRFDSELNDLAKIGTAWSRLKEHPQAEVKAVNYAARDGAQISGYLSQPPGAAPSGLPAVILPYDSASNRRVYGHDFLVQFLNASGYAVLQANYRGSMGFGKDWEGNGAFRDWERASGDIGAGARYLIDQKIADPARVCIAGWGFGGYAALMSGSEDPGMYKCIVSIGGPGNPEKLGEMARNMVSGRRYMSFGGGIGAAKAEFGSPEQRAGEIKAPVLLIQAAKDYTVPYAQFEDLGAALKAGGVKVETAEYEHAEHTIWPERYRIDLLARIGEFLDANL